jgi:hypothetical protein
MEYGYSQIASIFDDLDQVWLHRSCRQVSHMKLLALSVSLPVKRFVDKPAACSRGNGLRGPGTPAAGKTGEEDHLGHFSFILSDLFSIHADPEFFPFYKYLYIGR